MNQPEPNWERVERDVIHKLHLIRGAWKATAKAHPELHKAMVRDMYIPTIKHLAAFCASITEEDALPGGDYLFRIWKIPASDPRHEEDIADE